ncbi:MAG TPA: helix-turn-helix domain-containing protein [Firmicutes bacterium]|nr:helix-turn-helix domain-containing protein [Bacillota bacterium]
MANEMISRKLVKARKEAGYSQREVYEALGVKQSRFSAWENGKSEPDILSFLNLCRIYGIKDIDLYFLGARVSDASDPRVPKIIEKLSSLDSDGIDRALNCVEFESKLRFEKERGAKFRPKNIRVFMQPAAAGLGNYLSDSESEIMELDAPDGADIGVRISGDSMEPVINDGDIVFVKYQPWVEPGEVGIFSLNGDAYCKKLVRTSGGVFLESFNPKYKPIEVRESDNLTTFGAVIL